MDTRSLALALMFSLGAACGAASRPPPVGAGGPGSPSSTPTATDAPSGGGGSNPTRDGSPAGEGGGGGTTAPMVPPPDTTSQGVHQTRGDSNKTSPPPPPVDPKEAARSSGLTGPTDQGSFSDGFDDSVTITKLTGVEGDAEKDVRDALTHQLGTIEACYRDTLKKNAKVHGTFTLTFYVGTDGALQSAAIVGTKPADTALTKCLLGTVNATKLNHGLGKKKAKVTVALAFKAPT